MKTTYLFFLIIGIVFIGGCAPEDIFEEPQHEKYIPPLPGALDYEENDNKLPIVEDRQKQLNLNIPSCGDRKELFTQTPIKFDKLHFIRPLGFIGAAPEHVYPTDHIYLVPYSTEDDVPKKGFNVVV